MKRISLIVSQLVAFTIAALVHPPWLWATDGVNGTSGPALLDADTDQLFDSQHPDHTLIVGTETHVLTGHGTVSLTSVGGGTLYGANGIGFVNTSTVTVAGSYTQTTTNTWSSSNTYVVTGTGTISGTRTDVSGATKSITETFTYPASQTKTMTATANMPVGTSSAATNQTGAFASTHTLTATNTYTTTVSATADGTVTATGYYTGTGTATGTVTGSQTATGSLTISDVRVATVSRTFSSTSTMSGTGNTWTITDSASSTGSSTRSATYTEGPYTMTATATGTGTWTGSRSSSGYQTATLTTTNAFTVTTTSNSASVASNPTIVRTNRPGGAYMVDNDGCAAYLGICPIESWTKPAQGGVPWATLSASSGVVELSQSPMYYVPQASGACDRYYIWPAGTWTLRVRASATSLLYPSYIRAEVVVVGRHSPSEHMTCTGSVDSVVPTGLQADFPITAHYGDFAEISYEAFAGGVSASVEQTGAKNFIVEPNYPSGWNTQCVHIYPMDPETHPPVHFGLRISAFTTSPTPISVYFYSADLDTPVPVGNGRCGGS